MTCFLLAASFCPFQRRHFPVRSRSEKKRKNRFLRTFSGPLGARPNLRTPYSYAPGPGRKERLKGPPPPHLMSRFARRRRALVLVAAGASQGWTASLLSLAALEHHLLGLDVLVSVDRQA